MKRVTPKQGQTAEPVAYLSLFKIRLSKLAIMLGDAVAMVVAFVISLPLTAALVSPEGVSFKSWWAGQDTQRFIAWGLMGVLGLLLLLSRTRFELPT